ncbi:Oidioi.mRNA.OKI2018_I69.PAR.g8845.t1.cds [Oikopleura dioica]|uniref:Oidioi.mRNA.OKI2018_I69.PAR.g8845.t1.cds n=1 Tax=Oikopleura dioica TaxID=34765 RepID=A0ABN7RLB7_OIKDI|nr:Oidioi.mRNA.OKI2018_I69.PAR.g8845.t1.cds [Oikopleura dioica]
MCIKFFKRKPIDEETDDFDHIRHELPGLPSAAPSRRLTRRKTAKSTRTSKINRTDRLTSIFRKTPIDNEQRPSGRWSQISNRPSYLSTAELDDNLSDDFISSTLSNCKPGLRDSQAQQLFE